MEPFYHLKKIANNALLVIEELGIDINNQYPKSIDEILNKTSGFPIADNVDEINHQITFEYSGSNNLNGDYTAGDNASFPAEASTYESNKDGLWTDQTIWTPVGSSPPCPLGGPDGANVIINHIVSIDIKICRNRSRI